MIIRLGKFTYSIWTSINELPSSSLWVERWRRNEEDNFHMAVRSQQSPYISSTSKMPCKTIATFEKKERTTKNQHWNHELKVLATNAKQKDMDILPNGKHKQQKDGLTVLWFYGFTVLSFAGVLVYRFASMVDMQVNNK